LPTSGRLTSIVAHGSFRGSLTRNCSSDIETIVTLLGALSFVT